MLKHTIQHVAEQLATELPPLNDQQQAILEDPSDPVAQRLLALAPLVEHLPANEQAQTFLPMLERMLRIEALHAEITMYDDVGRDLLHEAAVRRRRAREFLDELELAVRTW